MILLALGKTIFLYVFSRVLLFQCLVNTPKLDLNGLIPTWIKEYQWFIMLSDFQNIFSSWADTGPFVGCSAYWQQLFLAAFYWTSTDFPLLIDYNLVMAALIFTSLNSELWDTWFHFFYEHKNVGLEMGFDKLQLMTDLIKTSIFQSYSKERKSYLSSPMSSDWEVTDVKKKPVGLAVKDT